MKTMFVLVSCCLDPTRTQQLSETVSSLPDSCLDAMLVIDNGSTDPSVVEILSKFPRVIWLDRNYGYWSAVNYALSLTDTAEYVYVIESDMVHYDFASLMYAESFLDNNSNIGSVRLQEFNVAQSYLYDKNTPREDSRRWAWTRLSNHFTGKVAYFRPDRHSCYVTNLAPQVPALNRMAFMQDAFSKLAAKESIAEVDFQRCYFDTYAETAVLDGGIYNCRSSYERAITSSYTDPALLNSMGYRPTRFDSIVPSSEIRLKS